jgi:hypothetical protein
MDKQTDGQQTDIWTDEQTQKYKMIIQKKERKKERQMITNILWKERKNDK